jgi:hypothetical protein
MHGLFQQINTQLTLAPMLFQISSSRVGVSRKSSPTSLSAPPPPLHVMNSVPHNNNENNNDDNNNNDGNEIDLVNK